MKSLGRDLVSYAFDSNAKLNPEAPLYTDADWDLVSYAFDSNAKLNPEAPLYTDADCPSRSLNARQTRILIRKLIAGFQNAGLQKGDRVVVHLFNNYLYSALFLAIIGAGGIYVGSNPAYQVFEIDHLLQLAEPTMIITSPDLLPRVIEAARQRGIEPSSSIYHLNAKDFDIPGQTLLSPTSSPRGSLENHHTTETGTHALESLLAYGESDWIRLPNKKSAEATPAAYFTTSGTSGLPKAAILSHAALIAQHGCIHQHVPYEVTRLMCLPSFHILGCLFTHIFPLKYGEPLYIQARFNLNDYVNAIHRLSITDTVMSPPMVFAINRSPLALQPKLQSLRYVVCGGERLMAPSQQEFYKHLSPDAVFTQVWGMTEIGAVTLFKYPEKDFSASVGRILPGCEIKLVDSNGATIAKDGKSGEAYVRTKNVMSGYKNMTQAQSCIGEDGWVATGDVFSMKDGKCYVQGRSKEMVKVKGWQVSPAELETVLKQHDQIADAAVAGIVRADGVTEVPRAYVVRKASSDTTTMLNAETVYQFARTRLASYKALTGGVVFVDHIPRTASGKVQRFKLKALTPELEVVENMVAAHCQALANPEVLGKIGAASAEVRSSKRKASTNTQAFMDALELSNERMAKRRRAKTGKGDDTAVPVVA